MSELPDVRKIDDAGALRALAHPLRLRLMEELVIGGPATATQLAELVGESPANCSWHLRQLAKYGYIEELPGPGRQRPWRFVLELHSWDDTQGAPEVKQAGNAASAVILEHEVQALHAWMAAAPAESPEWREAAGFTTSMGWFTVEEVKVIQEEIHEVVMRGLGRLTDPETRPEGARLVRMMAWAVPVRPGEALPVDQTRRGGTGPTIRAHAVGTEPANGETDA